MQSYDTCTNIKLEHVIENDLHSLNIFPFIKNILDGAFEKLLEHVSADPIFGANSVLDLSKIFYIILLFTRTSSSLDFKLHKC